MSSTKDTTFVLAGPSADAKTESIAMVVLEAEHAPPVTMSTNLEQAEQAIADRGEANQPADDSDEGSMDKAGVWLLGVQHFSSAWGGRSAEFAFPLIELFRNTLLPASLYGFIVTACGIILAGSVGSLVDKYHRLPAARASIFSQKLSTSICYALFIILFTKGAHDVRLLWPLFAAIAVCGCVLNLSTTGTTVCIERDWVMTIAGGRHAPLVRLNGIMRRIDLLCKLLSPLFVSLLTTTVGYMLSAAVLLAMGVGTAAFEFIFVAVVYRRFPALGVPRERQVSSAREGANDVVGREGSSVARCMRRSLAWLRRERSDWTEFVKHPIFLSSLSVALLYMTVLSFDGTFVSYLKSETDFSDPFIAGMRAICVLAGLLGTFVMPWLDRLLGLTRAGSWSIWSEVLFLVPVVISLYLSMQRRYLPTWNSVMLFGGMALSRIGLWSFDLTQLTQLQKVLDRHPRQNALTALQIALQNVFTLGAYALTLGWHEPRQFKFAATVSLSSVFAGAVVYLFGYSRRQRGHVFHPEKLPLLWRKVQ